MTLVLKPKHSLLGKSLLPVIMELKSNQPGMQIDTFARLKKDHPLEKYSLEELKVEFNRLTGETIQSLLIILSQWIWLGRLCIFQFCMQIMWEHPRVRF